MLYIRGDFPILENLASFESGGGVYFDNAATTQKPKVVIDTLNDYYLNFNANVHRGVHHLSVLATEKYEEARVVVQEFLNVRESAEIIFTRGTTEAINLVAQCYGGFNVGKDDRVVVTVAEHHSNFVPWQQLCLRKGAEFIVLPVDRQGILDISLLEDELRKGAKILAIAHIHNVTGAVMPLQEIIALAHRHGAVVLVDGAQGAAHTATDLQQLDCDFYTFSGHKAYAAMGIGVLYGKRELLEAMPPYQFGGEMIETVSVERTTFNELPYKFEAGTPSVADALTLSASLRYLKETGLDKIATHERILTQYAYSELQKIEGIEFYSPPTSSSIISFNIKNISHYDIGVLLDKQGIAVRTGHHCAEPLMHHFGINGTVRVSFAPYNTIQEIDKFIAALKKACQMLC
jgi:cysteine desulfurase/selenocysteine lyase